MFVLFIDDLAMHVTCRSARKIPPSGKRPLGRNFLTLFVGVKGNLDPRVSNDFQPQFQLVEILIQPWERGWVKGYQCIL